MAKKKATTPAENDSAAQVISYRHADKRKNNPEVGIVTPATDPEAGKTHWAYDPHINGVRSQSEIPPQHWLKLLFIER